MGEEKPQPSSGASSSRRQTLTMRCHDKVELASQNFFEKLGYWVATRQKITLVGAAVFVILCCFGFANFVVESDGEDLWAPAGSESKQDEAIVESLFGEADETANLLVTAKNQGDNVLTVAAFEELWTLDTKMKEIEISGKTYDNGLCSTGGDGLCKQFGALAFWEGDYDTYQAQVTTDADLLAALAADTYPDGSDVIYGAIFALDDNSLDADGNIVSSAGMSQTYVVMPGSDGDDWQADFLDIAEAENEAASELAVYYLAERSIDDELERSVAGETFLFVITYIVMITFVCLALGKRGGCVNMRSTLGFAGIMSVIFSGLAAYGINAAFEVPFTSLSQILPFILVGIGVDDMFIIVGAFDRTDPSLPAEERCAKALGRVGLSITYTSLTDFFAFMLGSTSSLPAVEYFCLYAGTAIIFDFAFQVTAFVAVLAWDARRQAAHRYDCCCCCMSSVHAALSSAQVADRGMAPSASNPVHAVQGGDVKADGDSDNSISKPAVSLRPDTESLRLSKAGKFFKETYAPALLSTPGKIVALLGTAALLAAGIYGVTQASEGFDVVNLTPDDSYVRTYNDVATDIDLDFSEDFFPVAVYFQQVDYTDTDIQVDIQNIQAAMLALDNIDSDELDSYFTDFLEWASTSTYSASVGTQDTWPVYTDASTFYAALGDFLAVAENTRFEDDIVFLDNGEIQISRANFQLVDIGDVDGEVQAIRDVRDVMDTSEQDPKPFGYSPVFPFTEQFLVMYQELIINFVLALVAVFVLSLIVLGRVRYTLLACFTLVIVDIELLGFIYHWGLDINSITGIELIMAVGLVVDYMVHVIHFFLAQDPDVPRQDRVLRAMGEIGPSVLLGGSTTFLGIIPMAFAANFIFRVFFQMFLIIIAFGIFHGLVFIPVMLDLLPEDCSCTGGGKDDSEENVGKDVAADGVGAQVVEAS